MHHLDNLLNKITTYRLTLYVLTVYMVLAFILSLLRVLPYDPIQFALHSVVILTSCWVSNSFFAKIFKAATNIESVFITSFILILITPIQFPLPFFYFVALGVVAMASKYFLTYNKKHIFNPAAVAVFVASLVSPDFAATWWIGNPIMFIPVLLGGILVVRKIRHEKMVGTFLGIYLLIVAIISISQTGNVQAFLSPLLITLTNSALVFFATIMLVEPLTTPVTFRNHMVYSTLVALLFANPLLGVTHYQITAEAALLMGNIFAFIVNPKYRLQLALQTKKQLSQDLYSFTFQKPAHFHFKPGQYMEWTLPHQKPDTRGNRRYFSLASSPTESNIMIALRKYSPSSTFKTALVNAASNQVITASSLSGDFVLPKDLSQPLVFLAGGIGITPFRSMVKYILDKKIKGDVVLLFVMKKKEDFVFQDVFQRAEEYGIKTIPLVTEYHLLDAETIKKSIPDYKNRIFYISGPQPMVQNYKKMLKKMGVKKIKTDFFPGYDII